MCSLAPAPRRNARPPARSARTTRSRGRDGRRWPRRSPSARGPAAGRARSRPPGTPGAPLPAAAQRSSAPVFRRSSLTTISAPMLPCASKPHLSAPRMTQPQRPRAVNVVVATTVMLSFISFWRAAAIVLSDLASSAYYVGGGVYKVVHEAMGGTLAKFSVSALMFDYVLTGPISGVSAGLYLGGLVNETGAYLKIPGLHVHPPYFAAVFAAAVTIYFWRKNIIGLHESSEKALRIMQITTVMVVILLVWCLITIFMNGYQPVPLPTLANLHFSKEGLGWLRGTAAPSITIIAVLIGLGHSLLAMSGEESLAQVNREIAYPKLKNLERAGFVIFIYSMLFTSLVSFFAVMIVPDAARQKFLNNLIGGLSMFLV